MKYSTNQVCISSFVVGRTGSECGPPVAVIKNREAEFYRTGAFSLLTTV
ncbi:hypothetical protein [Desulfocicer vacuolatum]|nr:hypothetical protein [Desulfocicer vacuolatum]